MKKRHFAYDVNVGRIDSNAGVDAYVFAGPVSGPDFQSEVVDQQFKVMGLVVQRLSAQPVDERQETVREIVLDQPPIIGPSSTCPAISYLATMVCGIVTLTMTSLAR